MPALTRWTPHLWVGQSEYFFTNSGVFLSAGQAVLVDPCMRPEEIDRIGQFVAEQGAEPRWLVLTHSHWDHVLGPERLPGIRRVAHARYPEVVARDAAGIEGEIARWEASFGRHRGPDEAFRVPLPDETCEHERVLSAGRLRLKLIHVPGHAPDQLAVYEPEQACLWASDILSDVEIPMVSDSLAAYERTLERLSTYEVRVLVPGHGHPTTDAGEIWARWEDDRDYLSELRGRVSAAVQAGRTVDEAVAACASMRYRHPDENAQTHQLNVESTYLELGGQADPRRVGYRQDWSLKREEKP